MLDLINFFREDIEKELNKNSESYIRELPFDYYKRVKDTIHVDGRILNVDYTVSPGNYISIIELNDLNGNIFLNTPVEDKCLEKLKKLENNKNQAKKSNNINGSISKNKSFNESKNINIKKYTNIENKYNFGPMEKKSDWV